MVERLLYTQDVGGSSPSPPTIVLFFARNQVAGAGPPPGAHPAWPARISVYSGREAARGLLIVARLFISHSSANNGAAFALRDWLSEQGFNDVFLAVDPGRGLVAGERWQGALKAAADRCEVALFLGSPAWLTPAARMARSMMTMVQTLLTITCLRDSWAPASDTAAAYGRADSPPSRVSSIALLVIAGGACATSAASRWRSVPSMGLISMFIAFAV